MTEQEKLQRAKIYMEKLANGINPLDDTTLPDTDIVNQVRISRCFFYVAEVLQQVIESTQQPLPTTAVEKDYFYIPPERRDLFEFSETPLSLSEIAARLNVLRSNETYKKLTHDNLSAWLEEAGILCRETYGEKSYLRPSEQGKNFGIALERRTGTTGEYTVVVYPQEVQHLILDNLDGLFAYLRDFTEIHQKRWTEEDETRLIALCQQGFSCHEISKILKRSPSSIRSRMKKYRIIPQ